MCVEHVRRSDRVQLCESHYSMYNGYDNSRIHGPRSSHKLHSFENKCADKIEIQCNNESDSINNSNSNSNSMSTSTRSGLNFVRSLSKARRNSISNINNTGVSNSNSNNNNNHSNSNSNGNGDNNHCDNRINADDKNNTKNANTNTSTHTNINTNKDINSNSNSESSNSGSGSSNSASVSVSGNMANSSITPRNKNRSTQSFHGLGVLTFREYVTASMIGRYCSTTTHVWSGVIITHPYNSNKNIMFYFTSLKIIVFVIIMIF